MRLVLVFLLWTNGAAAQAPSSVDIRYCKTIEEAAPRLKCYEEASAAVERGAPTAKEIISEILSSPAATAAIVAALLALISGVLGPSVQLRIGKRQAAAAQTSANAAMLTAQNAGSREIARMRIAWMDKLRDTLSEYHSILMSVDERQRPTQAQKLAELGTQLDLLLNQNDSIQKVLWDLADKIHHTDSLEQRQSFDEPLIAAARNVFKSEWEKIKVEMRGERF